MRVLVCERIFSGHRKKYMEWICMGSEADFFCYAPENAGVLEERFFAYNETGSLKSFRAYRKWVGTIAGLVKKYEIDIVHILDGDSIMRFFGYGMHLLKNVRVVITYHHFFEGTLRKLSYRMLSGAENRIAVAHTKNVQRELKKIGLARTELCEYPVFEYELMAGEQPADCRQLWGLPAGVPVIGIVGGMNRYKNILPFLKLMQQCRRDFHLLICGKANDISEDEIADATAGYQSRVTKKISILSDEEYRKALAASDIVYCIYGHEFNGASGPLADGVCAEKMILASAHGSLGEIVRENELGFTVRCDDPQAVLACVEHALEACPAFHYSKAALAYRERLKPESFRKRYLEIYGS